MSATTTPTLFMPLKLGTLSLSHRVVLAPMTRLRADEHHIPTSLATDFYSQRGRTPGTLLISEATPIALKAGVFPGMPGIWNEAQVAAWKNVRTFPLAVKNRRR